MPAGEAVTSVLLFLTMMARKGTIPKPKTTKDMNTNATAAGIPVLENIGQNNGAPITTNAKGTRTAEIGNRLDVASCSARNQTFLKRLANPLRAQDNLVVRNRVGQRKTQK